MMFNDSPYTWKRRQAIYNGLLYNSYVYDMCDLEIELIF